MIRLTVDGRSETDVSLAFQGRLMEVIEEKRALLERAYPRAMERGVTQPGKRKLRATVEATGFYQAGRLAKAIWRGVTYPPGKPTLEPVAWFQVGRGKGFSGSQRELINIVEAFEDGVTITVHNAQYLAIPQGPAKGIVHALNRARAKSGVFSNEANPVQRVAAALGTALIPIVSQRTGQGVLIAANSARLIRTGRMAKNQTGKPTVLFVLSRTATLKKRAMGREVLAQLQASFAADFAGALASELGPEGA